MLITQNSLSDFLTMRRMSNKQYALHEITIPMYAVSFRYIPLFKVSEMSSQLQISSQSEYIQQGIQIKHKLYLNT